LAGWLRSLGCVLLAAALGVLLASPALSMADSGGSSSCANARYVGSRTYLLACRAYELVTPAYKEGFLVSANGIAEDGSRVLSASFGIFGGAEGTSSVPQSYELARQAQGPEVEWTPLPLDFPFARFTSYLLEAISPDFQSALWVASEPASAGQVSRENIYRGSPSGPDPLSLIGPGEPPVGGGKAFTFVGGSDDLEHLLFVITSANHGEADHLWPGDRTADGQLPSLYEYEGTDNSEPRLVGVSNSGFPEGVATSSLISECGIYLGGSEGDAYNAVSRNGEVVFFTAAASTCGHPGPPVSELYARVDGRRTVPISEPGEAECSECDLSVPADAEFQGASQDGSKAFFTTKQSLLPGTTGLGLNLYEYDFNASLGKRVVRISRNGSVGDGDVLGVARVSEDGTHVYFAAESILTGANGEGKSPHLGQANLYVWVRECPLGEAVCGHPSEHVSFIATLASADDADWSAHDTRPAQATPEGRFVVFESSADLTDDQQGRIEAGQIFEYDAQTERLLRVSHGQKGFNEDGHSSTYRAVIPVQNYTKDPPIQRFTRLALTADGSRVFFSSEDALTRQALGGSNNVYEYHEGEVGLVSDGHDTAFTEGFPAVELVGADESGRDVFFTTADRLVPQDTDDQVDLYDARIGGGYPMPAEAAPCSGDSCQGAVGVPPLLSSPATSSVAGEATQVPPGVTHAHKSKPKSKSKPKRKAKRKRAKRRKQQRRRSVASRGK
jgi:hypothetical protein